MLIKRVMNYTCFIYSMTRDNGLKSITMSMLLRNINGNLSFQRHTRGAMCYVYRNYCYIETGVLVIARRKCHYENSASQSFRMGDDNKFFRVHDGKFEEGVRVSPLTSGVLSRNTTASIALIQRPINSYLSHTLWGGFATGVSSVVSCACP